jgi:hypothetical protein
MFVRPKCGLQRDALALWATIENACRPTQPNSAMALGTFFTGYHVQTERQDTGTKQWNRRLLGCLSTSLHTVLLSVYKAEHRHLIALWRSWDCFDSSYVCDEG